MLGLLRLGPDYSWSFSAACAAVLAGLDSGSRVRSKVSINTCTPATPSSNTSTVPGGKSGGKVGRTGEYDVASGLCVSFASEFSVKAFGDKRLCNRAIQFAESAFRHPEQSLPGMAGAAGQAAGLYRYLANKNVAVEACSSEHFEQTRQRVQQSKMTVLVVHDSTTVGYGLHTRRTGLGMIAGGVLA